MSSMDAHQIIVLPSGNKGPETYNLSNYEQAPEKLQQLRDSGVPRKRLVCYKLVEVRTENTRRN